jgi:hypothetical protein
MQMYCQVDKQTVRYDHALSVYTRIIAQCACIEVYKNNTVKHIQTNQEFNQLLENCVSAPV